MQEEFVANIQKPLSILLALTMILSVLAMIPFTTASAVTVNGTGERWIKGTFMEYDDSGITRSLYAFGNDVYSNITIVRFSRNAVPSWSEANRGRTPDEAWPEGKNTFRMSGVYSGNSTDLNGI